jgi:hypothetical protein
MNPFKPWKKGYPGIWQKKAEGAVSKGSLFSVKRERFGKFLLKRKNER